MAMVDLKEDGEIYKIKSKQSKQTLMSNVENMKTKFRERYILTITIADLKKKIHTKNARSKFSRQKSASLAAT